MNPIQGETEFLANETIKVNPNGVKQGVIPKKESLGIANNKIDPNGRQKELVPRRPFGSLLLFAIPGDSFLGIPPCFAPLGFTLIVLFAKKSVSSRRGFSVVLFYWGTPFLLVTTC